MSSTHPPPSSANERAKTKAEDKKLTQSYQEVQDHLAEGANRLALDEQTRQRLLAALHSEAQGPRDRLTPPKDTEVPRDYAPKAPNTPGMLDEHYGLKR